MPLKEFTFEPGLTKNFMDFGYEIYQADSNWIPPLRSDLGRQLKEDSPFHLKPGNHQRKFVAIAGGKVCGRVAAMVNDDLKNQEGEQVGTLGFFECVNDYHVAQDLIETSLQWLNGEMGISHVWGPMNFDIWHSYRFMTKGFDRDLFFGEPYNKPYYPEFFERFGFKTLHMWDSLEMEGRENIERMIRRGFKRYAYLKKNGYRFETLNKAQFTEDVKKIHTMITRTFDNFPGFTPLSYKEFLQLYSGRRLAIDPELVAFVYNVEGETAGFMAGFPELGDAVRAMNGRKSPVSALRFLKMRRRVDRINFNLAGAIHEETIKGSGLGRAGFYYIVNQALRRGYEKLLFTLRMVGNPSRSLPGPNTPAPQREYALFGLSR
jgi:hypothetical protein